MPTLKKIRDTMKKLKVSDEIMDQFNFDDDSNKPCSFTFEVIM